MIDQISCMEPICQVLGYPDNQANFAFTDRSKNNDSAADLVF